MVVPWCLSPYPQMRLDLNIERGTLDGFQRWGYSYKLLKYAVKDKLHGEFYVSQPKIRWNQVNQEIQRYLPSMHSPSGSLKFWFQMCF